MAFTREDITPATTPAEAEKPEEEKSMFETAWDRVGGLASGVADLFVSGRSDDVAAEKVYEQNRQWLEDKGVGDIRDSRWSFDMGKLGQNDKSEKIKNISNEYKSKIVELNDSFDKGEVNEEQVDTFLSDFNKRLRDYGIDSFTPNSLEDVGKFISIGDELSAKQDEYFKKNMFSAAPETKTPVGSFEKIYDAVRDKAFTDEYMGKLKTGEISVGDYEVRKEDFGRVVHDLTQYFSEKADSIYENIQGVIDNYDLSESDRELLDESKRLYERYYNSSIELIPILAQNGTKGHEEVAKLFEEKTGMRVSEAFGDETRSEGKGDDIQNQEAIPDKIRRNMNNIRASHPEFSAKYLVDAATHVLGYARLGVDTVKDVVPQLLGISDIVQSEFSRVDLLNVMSEVDYVPGDTTGWEFIKGGLRNAATYSTDIVDLLLPTGWVGAGLKATKWGKVISGAGKLAENLDEAKRMIHSGEMFTKFDKFAEVLGAIGRKEWGKGAAAVLRGTAMAFAETVYYDAKIQNMIDIPYTNTDFVFGIAFDSIATASRLLKGVNAYKKMGILELKKLTDDPNFILDYTDAMVRRGGGDLTIMTKDEIAIATKAAKEQFDNSIKVVEELVDKVPAAAKDARNKQLMRDTAAGKDNAIEKIQLEKTAPISDVKVNQKKSDLLTEIADSIKDVNKRKYEDHTVPGVSKRNDALYLQGTAPDEVLGKFSEPNIMTEDIFRQTFPEGKEGLFQTNDAYVLAEKNIDGTFSTRVLDNKTVANTSDPSIKYSKTLEKQGAVKADIDLTRDTISKMKVIEEEVSTVKAKFFERVQVATEEDKDIFDEIFKVINSLPKTEKGVIISTQVDHHNEILMGVSFAYYVYNNPAALNILKNGDGSIQKSFVTSFIVDDPIYKQMFLNRLRTDKELVTKSLSKKVLISPERQAELIAKGIDPEKILEGFPISKSKNLLMSPERQAELIAKGIDPKEALDVEFESLLNYNTADTLIDSLNEKGFLSEMFPNYNISDTKGKIFKGITDQLAFYKIYNATNAASQGFGAVIKGIKDKEILNMVDGKFKLYKEKAEGLSDARAYYNVSTSAVNDIFTREYLQELKSTNIKDFISYSQAVVTSIDKVYRKIYGEGLSNSQKDFLSNNPIMEKIGEMDTDIKIDTAFDIESAVKQIYGADTGWKGMVSKDNMLPLFNIVMFPLIKFQESIEGSSIFDKTLLHELLHVHETVSKKAIDIFDLKKLTDGVPKFDYIDDIEQTQQLIGAELKNVKGNKGKREIIDKWLSEIRVDLYANIFSTLADKHVKNYNNIITYLYNKLPKSFKDKSVYGTVGDFDSLYSILIRYENLGPKKLADVPIVKRYLRMNGMKTDIDTVMENIGIGQELLNDYINLFIGNKRNPKFTKLSIDDFNELLSTNIDPIVDTIIPQVKKEIETIVDFTNIPTDKGILSHFKNQIAAIKKKYTGPQSEYGYGKRVFEEYNTKGHAWNKETFRKVTRKDYTRRARQIKYMETYSEFTPETWEMFVYNGLKSDIKKDMIKVIKNVINKGVEQTVYTKDMLDQRVSKIFERTSETVDIGSLDDIIVIDNRIKEEKVSVYKLLQKEARENFYLEVGKVTILEEAPKKFDPNKRYITLGEEIGDMPISSAIIPLSGYDFNVIDGKLVANAMSVSQIESLAREVNNSLPSFGLFTTPSEYNSALAKYNEIYGSTIDSTLQARDSFYFTNEVSHNGELIYALENKDIRSFVEDNMAETFTDVNIDKIVDVLYDNLGIEGGDAVKSIARDFIKNNFLEVKEMFSNAVAGKNPYIMATNKEKLRRLFSTSIEPLKDASGTVQTFMLAAFNSGLLGPRGFSWGKIYDALERDIAELTDEEKGMLRTFYTKNRSIIDDYAKSKSKYEVTSQKQEVSDSFLDELIEPDDLALDESGKWVANEVDMKDDFIPGITIDSDTYEKAYDYLRQVKLDKGVDDVIVGVLVDQGLLHAISSNFTKNNFGMEIGLSIFSKKNFPKKATTLSGEIKNVSSISGGTIERLMERVEDYPDYLKKFYFKSYLFELGYRGKITYYVNGKTGKIDDLSEMVNNLKKQVNKAKNDFINKGRYDLEKILDRVLEVGYADIPAVINGFEAVRRINTTDMFDIIYKDYNFISPKKHNNKIIDEYKTRDNIIYMLEDIKSVYNIGNEQIKGFKKSAFDKSLVSEYVKTSFKPEYSFVSLSDRVLNSPAPVSFYKVNRDILAEEFKKYGAEFDKNLQYKNFDTTYHLMKGKSGKVLTYSETKLREYLVNLFDQFALEQIGETGMSMSDFQKVFFSNLDKSEKYADYPLRLKAVMLLRKWMKIDDDLELVKTIDYADFSEKVLDPNLRKYFNTIRAKGNSNLTTAELLRKEMKEEYKLAFDVDTDLTFMNDIIFKNLTDLELYGIQSPKRLRYERPLYPRSPSGGLLDEEFMLTGHGEKLLNDFEKTFSEKGFNEFLPNEKGWEENLQSIIRDADNNKSALYLSAQKNFNVLREAFNLIDEGYDLVKKYILDNIEFNPRIFADFDNSADEERMRIYAKNPKFADEIESAVDDIGPGIENLDDKYYKEITTKQTKKLDESLSDISCD